MTCLTPLKVEAARRMRRDGLAWDRIAKALGTSAYVLRCELEPAYRAYKHEVSQRLRAAPKPKPPPPPKRHNRAQCDHQVTAASRIVPDDVLAERERRQAAQLEGRTLTETFFGDPPRGYSALDQRAKG